MIATRTLIALACALVLAYTPPPRCPDELLRSALSDVDLRVWLAVRATQGDNDRAWAKTKTYADRSGKAREQVSRALATLVAAGWLAVVGQRGRTREYACLVPDSRWAEPPPPVEPRTIASVTEGHAERDGASQTSVTHSHALRDAQSRETIASVTEGHAERDGASQTPRPPYKDQSVKGIQGQQGVQARARAREVLLALGFGDDPALVAEAEDSAAGVAGALAGDELVRAALCLQLTGAVPAKAREALGGLDPPARTALLVAVLRTGERPRTSPRTNYLLALARSLDDHDRSARYASQHSRADVPATADTTPRRAADDARGSTHGRADGQPRRNARERANQLSARDLERSGLNSLAILRARRDQGGDAAGDGPPGG